MGHHVSAAGIIPLKANQTKLLDFNTPDNKNSLKRFLGVINFYRPFLRELSGILKSLTDLSSPKVKFEWTAAAEYSFQAAKEAVRKIPTLAFPVDHAETRLCCDASDTGVEAVLE